MDTPENDDATGSGERPAALAKPSQVWRLPAQHQPTFGALRRAAPSRRFHHPVGRTSRITGTRNEAWDVATKRDAPRNGST